MLLNPLCRYRQIAINAVFLACLIVSGVVSSADKVVVIPLGSNSPDTLSVKDRNGITIANFAQYLSINEIVAYSDQGYFSVIDVFGNVSYVPSTEDISVTYSGANCTGVMHRDASKNIYKALVFMSRPTVSSNQADWRTVYTPRDAKVVISQPIGSASTLEFGCFNYPPNSFTSYALPVLFNDPSVTGFEFMDATFQYQSPLLVE